MATDIQIDLHGGSNEEREYIGSLIEKTLTDTGFTSVVNNAAPGEVDEREMSTLLDYATKANPALFDAVITINNAEEGESAPSEEVSSDDEEATVVETIEVFEY